MASRGMVQVSGTTYRIVARANVHEIVRLRDDRRVGAFRNDPCLRIVYSLIDEELLREIVREVLRMARIPWRTAGGLASAQPEFTGEYALFDELEQHESASPFRAWGALARRLRSSG